MLPIIRRNRRPLIDPEVATIIPPPEKRSDFGQFQSDSLALPKVDQSSSIPPSTPGSRSVTSDPISSIDARPINAETGSETSTSPNQPSTNSPPSTINNPLLCNPWSLQPGESATDYQLFAAWLQLPVPRTFRKAAATLGCSIQRLRRLSSRHHWQTRTDAFDNHRANATSIALDRLLDDEIADFQKRAERFRLQEWLLHEEMLEAARAAVRDLNTRPRRMSITELTRLLDLASTLGRRATGLPLDPANEEPAPRPNLEAEAALNKIYGDSSSESGLQPD